MGSREDAGIYLLETVGTLRQLWVKERNAIWAADDATAGIIISTDGAPTGSNSFTWVRGDGIGIRIFTQPFYALHGVLGDIYGGLWWIETPQADLNQWQLWQYDPIQGRIVLRLSAQGDLFKVGSPIVKSSLAPSLISARPQFAPDTGDITSIGLLVDTLDPAAQKLNMGVFRITIAMNGGDQGTVSGLPQILLAPDSYRGPLEVSPDRTKLAYFVYDPQHASLTSGFIKPANTVRVFTLEGRGASTIRTVYATENRFEFLAPNLAWQGNNKLVLARSRFAPGDTFGVDRFGIVEVKLPDIGEQPSGAAATSYLFPDQKELRDFAVCQDGKFTLTIVSNPNGNLELSRWDGTEKPQALFVLPSNLTRSFLCWQAPNVLVEVH